ncbi:MAG: hypothetical protein EPN37_08550 [Chitinophagaceae bacterium]|nr:MAG: hypothetical protein EPN37_08550 [Chitinophagaceae bacterium]
MKKLSIILTAYLLSMLLLNLNANAQSDKPYTDGPVWQLSFVQTKTGMADAYIKDLSEHWAKMMKAAKEEGLIMDYKIFESNTATPSDWDLLLMVEVKNYAALDNIGDKMDALSQRLFGQEDAGNKITISLNDIRKILGEKLARELIFK